MDVRLRCGRGVGGGVRGEALKLSRYDLRMRLRWISWFLFVVSSVAQKPLLRRTYDPTFFETTIIGTGCYQNVLNEDTDPGKLVRTQLLAPIERTVYEAWVKALPPDAKPPESTKADSVVQFRVMANGSVASKTLISSTGNRVFDEIALNSFKSAKLQPFPPSMTMRWVTIRMDFRVNMDGQRTSCKDLPATTRNQ